MRIRKKYSLSALELDILLSLSDHEFYGLEIMDKLNHNRPNPVDYGSFYPALDRCYEKGLLGWRWGDDEDGSGGGRRKYFKTTEFGKELLEMWQNYREGLGK